MSESDAAPKVVPDQPAPTFGNASRPLAIVAFEGWGNGAEVATTAADIIATAADSTDLLELDCDGCYDLQVARPVVVTANGRRILHYPTVRVLRGELDKRQLLTFLGPEPSLHWPQVARQIGQMCEEVDPEVVLCMGAYLAPTPHTRPVTVTVSGGSEATALRHHLEIATYEGPSGILQAVLCELEDREVPAASVWAAIPNYLATRPFMSGAFAMVRRFVELTGVQIDLSGVELVGRQEINSLNRVVASSQDMQMYLAELEQRYDATATSGDAIAAQLEQYLRDL